MNARVLRNLALMGCMLSALGVAERAWAQNNQACTYACNQQEGTCINSCHGCNSSTYQCCNSCTAQQQACIAACPK